MWSLWQEWDQELFLAINTMEGPWWWGGVNEVLSSYGLWLIVMAVCSVIALRYYGFDVVIMLIGLGVGMGPGYLVNGVILKSLIERPRPCMTLSVMSDEHRSQQGSSELWAADTMRMRHHDGCYSPWGMPSNHAMVMAYIALFILLRGRYWWGWVFAVGAVLVGYSRVYLGMHYVSDVVVGWLVGALWAKLMFGLYVNGLILIARTVGKHLVFFMAMADLRAQERGEDRAE